MSSQTDPWRKKKSSAIFFLFCFLVLSSFLHSTVAARYDKSSDEVSYNRQGFIFFIYQSSSGPVIEQLRTQLKTSLPKLEKFYHYSLSDSVQIHLYSPGNFRHLQHSWNIPDWGQALAVPERNIVILNTGQAMKMNIYSNLHQVMIHELSHIFLAKKTGEFQRTVPVWFNEGCALWISGERRPMEMLRKAVITNSLIDFDDLEYVLRYDPFMAELAYDQSLSAVQFLIENYGELSIKEILERINEESGFNEAFTRSIGRTPYHFEKEWKNSLQPASALEWTRYADTILWILLMPILFIIALVIRKFRTRKKILEWEQEEGEN